MGFSINADLLLSRTSLYTFVNKNFLLDFWSPVLKQKEVFTFIEGFFKKSSRYCTKFEVA